MTAASRSLATALWGARFASGLLPQSYTTNRDTTSGQTARMATEGSRRALPVRFGPGTDGKKPAVILAAARKRHLKSLAAAPR